MSRENVELIRRAIEAWNRGDIDGWLDQATPDFVWIPAGPAAVERSVYRGRDEVREAMAGGWETWQEFRFEESEIRDRGESVVWLGRVHARGRASEVELDQEFAIHAVVRNGRLARTEGFLSRAEALEAAGLREYAMSRENVEIVRDAHKALNGGNIDALIRLCDPAFRLDMSDRVFNPVIYKGHDGIRRFYRQVWDVWESVTWEPEKFLESSDRVLALLRESAKGRGSGVEIERRTAMLWTVRGGRLTSLRFFRDRTEALEAAGLRE